MVEPLTPGRLTEQSYCTDWSVAQVLSHLGSGAEIGLMMLPGALGEAEPVSRDAFGPVWDRWDARSQAVISRAESDATSYRERLGIARTVEQMRKQLEVLQAAASCKCSRP